MASKTIKVPKGVKHSIWSILDAALYPVAFLATVPVMIRGMGALNFGLWMLLNALITILQLLNFNSGIANMGMAVIRNISHAHANNDDRHVNDVINGTLHMTFILFLAISCIGMLLSFAVVRFGWWGLGDVQYLNVSSCISLAAVIAGLKYFDQVFQSIFKAYEKFKLSSVLNMIYRFGSLGLTLAMAVTRYTILQILLGNIVFLIVYLVGQFTCVKWIIPSYRTGSVKDTKLYTMLLHFSAWPWIQAVIIVLTFQTDRFWVSSYMGLKEVSSYGLAATMFNHIHMIFTAMAIWVLPRIAQMASKGEDPARLYHVVRGGIMGVIVVSLLAFYFISPSLMKIWLTTNTSISLPSLLNYIRAFIAFEIVFTHSILPAFYLNATGKGKLAAKLTLFYCGTSYVCMLGGLVLFHSAVAMVGGMTIAMCVAMPVVNGVVQKEMYDTYSWKHSLFEMLPMYAAILLLWNNSGPWVYLSLVIVIALLLWKFYLSKLINIKKWQQTPSL